MWPIEVFSNFQIHQYQLFSETKKDLKTVIQAVDLMYCKHVVLGIVPDGTKQMFENETVMWA